LAGVIAFHSLYSTWRVLKKSDVRRIGKFDTSENPANPPLVNSF
jgi:hypothetical protein